jgi:hypothetical protein
VAHGDISCQHEPAYVRGTLPLRRFATIREHAAASDCARVSRPGPTDGKTGTLRYHCREGSGSGHFFMRLQMNARMEISGLCAAGGGGEDVVGV